MTSVPDKHKPSPATSDEIRQAIHVLESAIQHPSRGLPNEVFLFVSSITPMVNVDLLIKNERNETLLTWREDEYYGPGWHVPGGIVRYKETSAQRIHAVAAGELGARVQCRIEPLAINEIISKRVVRGHFFSLLYECSLLTPPADERRFSGGVAKNSQWAWHRDCPDNLISVHEIYRRYIQPVTVGVE